MTPHFDQVTLSTMPAEFYTAQDYDDDLERFTKGSEISY